MLLTFGIDNDPLGHYSLFRAFLARVHCAEKLIQLLKRTSFCFFKEKVDEEEFENVPENEKDIETISNLGQSNWRGKGVDEAGASPRQLLDFPSFWRACHWS